MLHSIASDKPAARLASGAAPARRLGALAQLTADDFTLLAALKGRTVPAGTILTAETPSLILSGWAARISVWPLERPQVLTLLLPGDSFGINAAPWAGEEMPVSLLTDAVLLDASSLRSLADTRSVRHAALVEACRRASWLEQRRALDHIVRLSRCSADQRVAHFAHDLFARLGEVGLVDRNQFQLPLRQQILADVLGLSGVHFNRITRRLKQDGLADFSRGAVTVLDPAKLAKLAGIK